MCDFTFKKSAPAFLAKDKNTVFYPGAGTDIHDIAIFADHGASCFVHADYLEAPDLSGALEESGFEVLHSERLTFQNLTETAGLSESERFLANDWQDFTNAEAVREGISRWYVFQSGHKTLSMLQIFGEAHWVYEEIFAKNKKAAFGILLQDHGFGGGWARFGGASRLYELAQARLPQWLVVAENTDVWPGYDLSNEYHVGAGGQHGAGRDLWRKMDDHN